jgi:hydroxyacylglutathione hydrolase
VACLVVAIASGALLAGTLIGRVWWQPAISPGNAPIHPLPGDPLLWIWLPVGQAALFVALAAASLLGRIGGACPRPDIAANGFLAPLTAGLACVAGGAFAAGVNLVAARTLYDVILPDAPNLGPAPALVLPTGLYAFAVGLLVVSLAAVLLLLGGAIWYYWRRHVLARELLVDYPLAEASRTKRSRRFAAGAQVRGVIADHLGKLMAWLSLWAIAGVVAFDVAIAGGWRDKGFVRWAAATGVTVAVIVAGALVNYTRQAFSADATRRKLGYLWDVGTFWPRAAHPFAPPCYSERAVPENVNRLRRALGDERDPGEDPAVPSEEEARIEQVRAAAPDLARAVVLPRQERVLVNGYSQGNPVAVAIVAQLPDALMSRVAMVTEAAPARRLYGRAFPAYFGADCMTALATRLQTGPTGGSPSPVPRWLNVWRRTDYVGSWVLAPPTLDSRGVDRLITDPPRLAEDDHPALVPIHAHSDFWPDPQVGLAAAEVLDKAGWGLHMVGDHRSLATGPPGGTRSEGASSPGSANDGRAPIGRPARTDRVTPRFDAALFRAPERLAPEVYMIRGRPAHVINAYLVGDVLVDAGTRHSPRTILYQLAGREVSAVALTHAHADHQGGSHEICERLGIPLWCGAADAVAAENPCLMKARAPKDPGAILYYTLFKGPGHPVERELREGDEVAGFRVLEVPGHTAGHVAYWRESDRVLLCGDVLANIGQLTGIPGLHESSPKLTADPVRNRESLIRLAALEPELVCFGHGKPLRDPGKLRRFVQSLG